MVEKLLCVRMESCQYGKEKPRKVLWLMIYFLEGELPDVAVGWCGGKFRDDLEVVLPRVRVGVERVSRRRLVVVWR